jgi:hypothetical protein
MQPKRQPSRNLHIVSINDISMVVSNTLSRWLDISIDRFNYWINTVKGLIYLSIEN